MEFANRAGQQPAAPSAAPGRAPHASGGKKQRGKWLSIVSVFLLVATALLVAMVTFSMATSKEKKADEYIDSTKFQAVFLEGGSVYFGKLRELNSQYATLDNIYYLRVNNEGQSGENASQAQQDVSLTKLGCELHGPQDRMVINADQITFWENLKDDGQVAKAIAEFVKQNPDGQKCAEPQAQQ